jgi:hypothetical protein
VRSGTPDIRKIPVEDGLRLEAWLAGSRVGTATARPVALFENEQLCHIEVGRQHRRAGIGAALWAALDEHVPATEALITRVLHSQPDAVGFVESIGWDLVEHCPAPRVVPASPAWRAWAAGHPAPPGTIVGPSDAVSAEMVDEAFVDWYVWAHEMIGPLRPRDDVARAAAGTAAELDDQVSRLVLRDGRIAAFSLVFDDVSDGLRRVIAETTRVDEPGGTALVAAALAATLDACARRGDPLVELEGRTIDPHLPAVMSTFPPHDTAPMSVVRLHRPSHDAGGAATP